MRRTPPNSNGMLRLTAWCCLLLAVSFFVWRQPVLRFADDFFDFGFSTILKDQVLDIKLERKEPIPQEREVIPFEKELIPEISAAGRAELLRNAGKFELNESDEVADKYSAPTGVTGKYASQFEPDNRDAIPFAWPTPGEQLLSKEIPSISVLKTADGSVVDSPLDVPASIPKISDRNKLNALAPMVSLAGGSFQMGSDTAAERDQRPMHTIRLQPFRIDKYEVTNRQFRLFVSETNYVTTAERFGWSYIFDFQKKSWVRMVGANWRNPYGKKSEANAELTAMDNYPVVHVSWDDAQAFCDWSGKRLPTEAEWEFAAKGGLIGVAYPWGDRRVVNGVHQANYWQGWFPDENTVEDGYLRLAPVGSFTANRYEIFDAGGNAWEWCGDRYSSDYYRRCPLDNPLGPTADESDTATIPLLRIRNVDGNYVTEELGGIDVVSLRVIRGGSFLSAENGDAGYRITARGSQPQTLSFQDVGFRCAE